MNYRNYRIDYRTNVVAETLDEAVSQFALKELNENVEFPFVVRIREVEIGKAKAAHASEFVEVDRCSECREISIRNGDWYDEHCPGCADKLDGEDE